MGFPSKARRTSKPWTMCRSSTIHIVLLEPLRALNIPTILLISLKNRWINIRPILTKIHPSNPRIAMIASITFLLIIIINFIHPYSLNFYIFLCLKYPARTNAKILSFVAWFFRPCLNETAISEEVFAVVVESSLLRRLHILWKVFWCLMRWFRAFLNCLLQKCWFSNLLHSHFQLFFMPYFPWEVMLSSDADHGSWTMWKTLWVEDLVFLGQKQANIWIS